MSETTRRKALYWLALAAGLPVTLTARSWAAELKETDLHVKGMT